MAATRETSALHPSPFVNCSMQVVNGEVVENGTSNRCPEALMEGGFTLFTSSAKCGRRARCGCFEDPDRERLQPSGTELNKRTVFVK